MMLQHIIQHCTERFQDVRPAQMAQSINGGENRSQYAAKKTRLLHRSRAAIIVRSVLKENGAGEAIHEINYI